jgi:hypothetical protein
MKKQDGNLPSKKSVVADSFDGGAACVMNPESASAANLAGQRFRPEQNGHVHCQGKTLEQAEATCPENKLALSGLRLLARLSMARHRPGGEIRQSVIGWLSPY